MPYVPVDSFDLVPKIDRRTLTDSVYQHLREQLTIGNMVPGERLSLRELGGELGVSVMPVREAVNRLVAERALEVTAGRVLRVPLSTAEQIRDLTDIRMTMEGFAAERAALLRTADQLAAIESAGAALDALAANGPSDPGRWIALNRGLHFNIYHASRLPLLVKMIGDLWLRAGPILNQDIRALSRRNDAAEVARYHADAVRAIRSGDAAAARAAIVGDISAAAAYTIRNSHGLAV